MHLSASKHHTENALVGKDAITGEIVDGAAGVADLADLADLDQNVVADLELCAQGERKQVDTLAVPVPAVRIGSETKLFNDGIVPIGDGRLACAFVRRRVNRDDTGGSFVGVAGGA